MINHLPRPSLSLVCFPGETQTRGIEPGRGTLQLLPTGGSLADTVTSPAHHEHDNFNFSLRVLPTGDADRRELFRPVRSLPRPVW